MIVVCARESPRSAIISTRSRKLSLVAQIPAHAEDDYFAIEMAALEEFVHVEHSSALSFEQSAGKLCGVNPVRTRARHEWRACVPGVRAFDQLPTPPETPAANPTDQPENNEQDDRA